jgi:hypothetical protein
VDAELRTSDWRRDLLRCVRGSLPLPKYSIQVDSVTTDFVTNDDRIEETPLWFGLSRSFKVVQVQTSCSCTDGLSRKAGTVC